MTFESNLPFTLFRGISPWKHPSSIISFNTPDCFAADSLISKLSLSEDFRYKTLLGFEEEEEDEGSVDIVVLLINRSRVIVVERFLVYEHRNGLLGFI